jgi:putative spermidine/putrescine transport system ATP-binding protein
VTHDQREALTMSDRIAVIDKGRLAQLDTPQRIYSKPNNRFVAEFIGESTFLNVTVAAGVCRYRDAVVRADGAPPSDGRCLMMIRPEQLQIVDGAATDDMNRLSGRILGRVFQGDTMRIDVDLGGGDTVTLRVPANSAGLRSLPADGGAITLGLAVADTTLLPDGG